MLSEKYLTEVLPRTYGVCISLREDGILCQNEIYKALLQKDVESKQDRQQRIETCKQNLEDAKKPLTEEEILKNYEYDKNWLDERLQHYQNVLKEQLEELEKLNNVCQKINGWSRDRIITSIIPELKLKLEKQIQDTKRYISMYEKDKAEFPSFERYKEKEISRKSYTIDLVEKSLKEEENRELQNLAETYKQYIEDLKEVGLINEMSIL